MVSLGRWYCCTSLETISANAFNTRHPGADLFTVLFGELFFHPYLHEGELGSLVFAGDLGQFTCGRVWRLCDSLSALSILSTAETSDIFRT